MKPHYFEQDEADKDDVYLGMAKIQGYVKHTCLLGGMIVMDEIKKGRNPCHSCECPREKCCGVVKKS